LPEPAVAVELSDLRRRIMNFRMPFSHDVTALVIPDDRQIALWTGHG
jgi:hypothetical protein